MSAAEKLKALGERAVADRYQTIDQLREKYEGDWPAKSGEAQSLIYAALPQIVAVVEAAEWYQANLYLGGQVDDGQMAAVALDALDEALSE